MSTARPSFDTYSPEMLFSLPFEGRFDVSEKEIIEELMRRDCRVLVEAGYHIKYALVDAAPFDGISSAAEKWHADLIIIRKSSLRPPEAHLGHTTRVLIDHSRVPLLTYGRCARANVTAFVPCSLRVAGSLQSPDPGSPRVG